MTVALTWIPVHDDEVEDYEDDEGDQGVEPTDEEHDDNTHQAGHQTQPFVVILEHKTRFLKFPFTFIFVLSQLYQTSR